ncbi:MAG: type II toxin-antitoxin system HicB family antitoxin [Candidatus Kapabacteria bacterium]|jgi:predicted RNase H-like HicB family nuclease|nr:type II toxin-antitoxin system HicB family antitoxin [Candidatus Kapabacteria bacterium]
MTATLTAVYERHDDWYIGYVEELPGVNIQEATLEETCESLREAVQLIIESNRFLVSQKI